MSKQIKQLKQSLQELQERLAVLEKEEQGKMQEHKSAYKSMLPPLEDGGCWCIDVDMGVTEVCCAVDDQNLFPDEEIASAYADVFKVILELRRCEGSGERDEDSNGWTTDYMGNSDCWGSSLEYFSICPPFPSEELCEAAVEKVGRERILKAYRLLANVKGE